VKAFFLAGMLGLVSVGAVAELTPKSGDSSFCGSFGAMHRAISDWKGSGFDPMKTLEAVRSFQIPEKLTKEVINNIYFNPAFANAGGMALEMQVTQSCMYGPPKPFEPLK
jgi:hypothetical protein